MFFFWEITALCSYALISFNNDDPKAVAGGMKALIMTQLGASVSWRALYSLMSIPAALTSRFSAQKPKAFNRLFYR